MADTKLAVLRERVGQEPADGEAWTTLLADAESKGDLERTRELYEEFLKIFPDSGKHWVAYADLELRHSLFQKVEAIFGRCLRMSSSVDLWNFYLTYIRRMNQLEGVDTEKAKQARLVITKAYEFSLNFIGNDRDAGQIWQDYITFLRSLVPTGTWEEQQNMDSVRKTYQKAVTIPLTNVEQIWSEYNHWEQNLNKLTAKKFIAERSAAYMTARTALREMKPLTDGLFPLSLPKRPDWQNPRDRQLIEDWRKYLKWEEANPLQYEDQTLLQTRVLYAYRRAFTILRFYPEVWYTASSYARSIGKSDEALKFLENGRGANPLSLLVTFAYAEVQEERKNVEECYKAYDALISQYTTLVDQATTQRDEEVQKAVADAQTATKTETGEEKPEINGETNGDNEENIEEAENSTLVGEMAKIRDAITARAAPKIDSLKKATANVWITEMRFARRAEGIKQARAVFAKSRRSPHLTWEILHANAMMEYHWNKEPKIATNVFELGLKTFSDDVGFVVRYLDYLINTNDESNARAVFERTVTKLSPEQARPLWERWAQYESQYSDLAAIEKLDARIAETYPTVPAIFRFAERHVHSGLTELLTDDLGLLKSGANLTRKRSLSRSRSPSPPTRANKRASSRERGRRSPSPHRIRDRDPSKRQRRDSPSPPPMRHRLPTPPFMRDRNYQPPVNPIVLRPPVHLPPRPSHGEIPDAVAFFMGLLPMASLFNGPILPGNVMVDLLSNVTLPTNNAGNMGRSPLPIGPMGDNRYRM